MSYSNKKQYEQLTNVQAQSGRFFELGASPCVILHTPTIHSSFFATEYRYAEDGSVLATPPIGLPYGIRGVWPNSLNKIFGDSCYAFFEADGSNLGKCLYVGRAKKVGERLNTHLKGNNKGHQVISDYLSGITFHRVKEWPFVAIWGMLGNYANFEAIAINALRPELNKAKPKVIQ